MPDAQDEQARDDEPHTKCGSQAAVDPTRVRGGQAGQAGDCCDRQRWVDTGDVGPSSPR